MPFELTNEFLERFEQAVEEEQVDFIREVLDGVAPQDITALLDEFNAEESKYVIDLLPTEISAEIVNDLDEDVQARFLRNFASDEIAAFVNHLDSDDAVDMLMDLPVKTREEVIAMVDNAEKASHIVDLLRYEEDVAGGLMQKEFIRANINWTITQTIEEIRRQGEKVEKIYSVYVVDDSNLLKGRVSLKRIILARDDTRIADLYEPDIESVETYMDEEEVAQLMQKYDLDAVPVVNVQGKLVGRITIDDIVDVITELAEEERNMMAGISEDVEEDDSVWRLTRARLPWLTVGMLGGLLGAQFIGLFERDILLIPAMSFFIPLITATGGNVGIQSSSIILQSLANPSAFSESNWNRFFKALLVALLNGVILAGLVFGINMLFGQEVRLATVVSLALLSVVLLASFMGTVTPLVLNRFGINPALASGPFITTANDLLGLGVYFGVARLILSTL
ncbi:MAG TPA: magnesium transporter [Cytophagales bacterium]|nr:magnesium transporter [Cytophagales bacterium]HAA17721.1 magnesium transporter [Cytophagales bacterium]HAP60013.1 magnesium transporter [Cytophagales bacterium]